MTEPLISVILPVYNMEAYLERCLDSALNNTYRNLEIICVDDGSTDRSLEILHAYAQKDPRLIVIHKENGGVASARNAGLSRTAGEFVCFVDPDDLIHPQYFEFLFRALQETGLNISICGFQVIEIDGTVEQPEQYAFEPGSVRVCSFAQVFSTEKLMAFCWGKLIRSSLVTDVLFNEDLLFAEDTVFFAQVCEREKANQAAVLSLPLYSYCKREGSAVLNAGSPQFLQFGRVWDQLLQSSRRDDIYLDKALMWNFSKRYVSRSILPDRETAREHNKLLLKLRSFLWKTKIYGIAKKAAYLSFIYFPRLYWLYRVTTDPSMWKWEQVERKKRREARKGAKTEEEPL